MATNFIAVRCFQCSTMQVKQRKKSSNKWTCVVCNQKQSVLKVFFKASRAKQVRGFVQNFNMSRMLSDQKDLHQVGEGSFDSDETEGNIRKKRNDWTEYIDDEEEEEHCAKFGSDKNVTEGNGGTEPVIVTEMPKVIKKQKLRDYSSNSKKLFKPPMTNGDQRERRQEDHSVGRDCEYSKHGKETIPSQISSKMSAANGPQSKWSCYISQEEEDTKVESDDDVVQQMVETVEDDIHPDFL